MDNWETARLLGNTSLLRSIPSHYLRSCRKKPSLDFLTAPSIPFPNPIGNPRIFPSIAETDFPSSKPRFDNPDQDYLLANQQNTGNIGIECSQLRFLSASRSPPITSHFAHPHKNTFTLISKYMLHPIFFHNLPL